MDGLSVNGWVDGCLPGGGRADTDYSELGSRRPGFLGGYGRGNPSHTTAPGRGAQLTRLSLPALPRGPRRAPGRGAAVSLPSTGTPEPAHTRGPKTLRMTQRGKWEPGSLTQAKSQRESKRAPASGGSRWGRGRGAAVYELRPPGEPLAAGAPFKGKKWIFRQPQSLYCCTKRCIDEVGRSAWR